MYVMLYHYAREATIRAILTSRVILPNSCSDLYDCDFDSRRRLGGGPRCTEHHHGLNPDVVWLTDSPHWKAHWNRPYRIAVRMPTTGVERWSDFARRNGTDPYLIDKKVKLTQAVGCEEYVTKYAIPSECWIDIHNISTGKLLWNTHTGIDQPQARIQHHHAESAKRIAELADERARDVKQMSIAEDRAARAAARRRLDAACLTRKQLRPAKTTPLIKKTATIPPTPPRGMLARVLDIELP